MKNLLGSLLIAFVCIFAVNTAKAQSGVCAPDVSFTEAGLAPKMDSLTCIGRNIWQGITIYFKNYDTARYNGLLVTVDSVRVDTIGNMPSGYTWTSNKYPRNTFANSESGCLFISGLTTDPAGEYKLNIAVTAFIGGAGIPLNAASIGLRYDVRVIDTAGHACPAIDTAHANGVSTANGGKGTNNGVSVMNTGIFEADNSVSGMANYPNPFSGNTDVVFSTETAKQVTFRVYNVLGATMHTETINTVGGKNIVHFNGSSLEAGVYFYSITDGKKVSTNRFVVTK